MLFKLGKYDLKLWFIIVVALYTHTIMFKQLRIVTYVYAYGVPLAYLFVHINQVFYELDKLLKGRFVFFSAFAFFVLFGTVLAPLVNASNDFTFIFHGPVKRMFFSLLMNLFLLLLYKNAVTKEVDVIEYILYIVFANVFYVLGTVLICAAPSIHDFILNNIYMDEIAQNAASKSFYYTRIGWSGYSSFVPSFYCSISIALCVVFALASSGEKVFNISNILFLCMMVGCFCYARTGIISSVICIALYLAFLIKRGDIKVLSYPVLLVLIVVIFGILVESNDIIKNWYQWGFAQVSSYKETGSFESETISSLLNMYKTMPEGVTWLIGDGRYTSDTGFYYKSVDVGWLRTVFYYGVFFSLCQYGALISLIRGFTVNLRFRIGRQGERLLRLMMLAVFLVFESKGEIWYVMITFLLPLLLLQEDEKEARFSLAHIGKIPFMYGGT